MEKVHRLSQSNWRDIVFSSIAVFIVILDQITKALIRANLAYGQVWHDWGFLEIIHAQNTGASFGLFGRYTGVIIAVVFLEMIVILVVAYYLRNKLSFLDSMLMRVGVGLVLGGAIGNQIDRIAMGHVTDFIDFKVWPAFNVADSGAVIGTIIIAYCIIFKSGMMKTKNG
jgi:signal peptidase II